MIKAKGHFIWIFFLMASFGTYGQVYQPNYPDVTANHFKYLDDNTSDYLNKFIQYSEFDSSVFSVINPTLGVFLNSSRPFSQYDGSLWTGKGLSTELSFGFNGTWRNLEYSFLPRYSFSQNTSFDLGPIRSNTKSEFNYQFNVIGDVDFVQRFGTESLSNFNLGQSEIRYRSKYFTTAISTANFTLGPAINHSILMSRNASGFPHVEIGTNRFIPINLIGLDIGKIKIENVHGILQESEFFDSLSINDNRYFSSFEFSYIPSFYPDLKVGVHRVFNLDGQFFKPKDLARSLWYFTKEDKVIDAVGDTVNDFFDQMGGIYAEFNLKESKARAYGQVTINDFGFTNAANTGHSTGYTLGFEKYFELKTATILFNYETSKIAGNAGRAEPSYYLHYQVTQGYTHKGQLLGLASGPGSVVHTFSFRLVSEKHLLNFAIQRAQLDEDFFNREIGFSAPGVLIKDRKSADYLMNIDYTIVFDTINFSMMLRPSNQINRYYIAGNNSANLFLGVLIGKSF